MRNLTRYAVVLLVLASLAGAVTSCTPAATPTPMPTATPTPALPPTAMPTTVPQPTPTPAPTEAATATPTTAPEAVGTPASPDEVPRITMEELKELMDSGANIVILDNRPRVSFDTGHISGAISLPWRLELSEVDAEMIPWGVPIVTYCECGPGEADSADVALQLIKMDFEDVKALAHPSIEGWIEAGYPTK